MAARVKVSRYQNTSSLESVLGCRGVIKLIHSDTSYVIDFGEGKVATLHPGCIEMPSDQDDKLTVNTNCLKAAARGDQAAVEAFLTGQCCLLIGHLSSYWSFYISQGVTPVPSLSSSRITPPW